VNVAEWKLCYLGRKLRELVKRKTGCEEFQGILEDTEAACAASRHDWEYTDTGYNYDIGANYVCYVCTKCGKRASAWRECNGMEYRHHDTRIPGPYSGDLRRWPDAIDTGDIE